jgi:hypothetical protein
MTQVNLRLPDELKKLAERYAQEHGYKNLQELARESLREKVAEKEMEENKMKSLLKGLDVKTVRAILGVPEEEWKKNYKKMKESERRCLKLLTRASSSKGK